MTFSAGDRAELSDLVHRYAAEVDDRQFDSVADLFTSDAELLLPDPPGSLEPVRRHHGRAAIGEAVAAVAATIRTHHAIVGEVYDADPDSGLARGRVACVAHHWVRHDDQIRDVTWYLRYADSYQRMASGWRIRLRSLTIDAIDSRPVRQVRPGQS
ncbi:nuclear transport factor 2 family protein [Candidatus Mycobacterium wuenschmannii]|uniref:Nuclear transport factor 2 family protein n=1 Tax=Candidatus Mycobacterium wuenschmannii TaxID=3027808 RepID=A0ABY8W365_9MYCO|nr:nuclear transport factor 2 family protein [Candidatus Mycobacterium wuenschmannii]WIM90182.1 nuclear transport factor 2 family protein [Candidatus Mycobacterium wuenschmannii]